jgi:L-aspartate oxidase
VTAPALAGAAGRPAGPPGAEPLDVPVSARLAAPAPSWQVRTDVLVVGSGVAGLSLVAGLAGSGLHVHLVTKGRLGDGSTRWAQGGIARANHDAGDVEQHVRDTLMAGAGLCDPATVRRLVVEGPAAVERLAALGARFDTGPDGRVALTREGGHSRARIVHAGGDATGAEVQRALQAALAAGSRHEDVTTLEDAFLLDLLRGPDGDVRGAAVALLDAAGSCRSVGLVHARATVLATGGLGQAFASTTNPAAVTGDGIAAALRAGAELADLEFVQFHPTVFAGSGGDAEGRRLLVSEAVRGEGAVLVDAEGASVMAGAHRLADLAPRDVVSATMAAAMRERGVDHLFLDARTLGGATLLARFPTIVAGCRGAGVDPLTEPIPVRPAAHYTCGGVRADLTGRTGLPGLYAIGEVSCTGVHGANRLASNSLLEGLVAAGRLAAFLRDGLPPTRGRGRLWIPRDRATGVDPALRTGLTRAMDADAGVRRDPAALTRLVDRLADAAPTAAHAVPGRACWEATNLHTLMAVITGAALRRTESRGCHRRSDVEATRPQWRRHLVSTLDTDDTATVPSVVLQEIS